MNETPYTLFKSKIKAQIAETTEFLAYGKCGTLEEYKRNCGIIAGLKQSLELMREAIKESSEDNDD